MQANPNIPSSIYWAKIWCILLEEQSECPWISFTSSTELKSRSTLKIITPLNVAKISLCQNRQIWKSSFESNPYFFVLFFSSWPGSSPWKNLITKNSVWINECIFPYILKYHDNLKFLSQFTLSWLQLNIRF